MHKHKYLCKADRQDTRDYLFAKRSPSTPIPPKMDLRFACSQVVDQGALGSCTANAIASGLKEFWTKAGSHSGIYTPLSRLWLYWQERSLESTIGEDAGAMIRDGMKVLQQIGCATEADWPYNVSKFTQTPPTKATEEAGTFKIAEYHRVTDLTTLKGALAEGYPVVMGIDVYDSFESNNVARTGIVPIPKPRELCLGGHAVLAVGYDDAKQTVITRNSWGEGWGDKGYFYLPYGYFAKYVSDMWTGK